MKCHNDKTNLWLFPTKAGWGAAVGEEQWDPAGLRRQKNSAKLPEHKQSLRNLDAMPVQSTSGFTTCPSREMKTNIIPHKLLIWRNKKVDFIVLVSSPLLSTDKGLKVWYGFLCSSFIFYLFFFIYFFFIFLLYIFCLCARQKLLLLIEAKPSSSALAPKKGHSSFLREMGTPRALTPRVPQRNIPCLHSLASLV